MQWSQASAERHALMADLHTLDAIAVAIEKGLLLQPANRSPIRKAWLAALAHIPAMRMRMVPVSIISRIAIIRLHGLWMIIDRLRLLIIRIRRSGIIAR
jgi:hypothetical protein